MEFLPQNQVNHTLLCLLYIYCNFRYEFYELTTSTYLQHLFFTISADCNSEAVSQINEINRIRGFVNKVECDQNLVWLAWKHTLDQIEWESRGGTYNDNCNLHSWHTTPELQCCYPSNHSKALSICT